MSLKSKILLEANRNLELRYLQKKFILQEQKANPIELANKKLNDLGIDLDVSSFLPNNPITETELLCIPKTGDDKKDNLIKSVSLWLDNNMDNKSVIEIKLNELSKLLKVISSSKTNTDLLEQLGSDSVMFGNTPISKEDVLEIGNELLFLIVMSLVIAKSESKIERKFCIK